MSFNLLFIFSFHSIVIHNRTKALVMHRLITSTSEIGLSALKLNYRYWFFFSRYFIFIHDNIKVDDIIILVIKYLLPQS